MSFSGGTFSINTTGQPVVSGTTISASVFNALTADLATGLSTCMLKDGTQTATAGIGFFAGTVSLPGIYFGTDTATGFYRIGLNNVGYAVNGTKLLDMTGTTLAITSTVTANTIGVTSGTTATVFNTTATTVNAFGAASVALNIGHASGTNTILGATTFSQGVNGTVGSGTPAAGSFTTLAASGAFTGMSSGASPVLTYGNASSGDTSWRMVMLASSAVKNWEMSFNNYSNGISLTPSTATGGSTFTTPVHTVSDAGIVTMSAYGAGTATFSAAGVISSVSDETYKIKDGVINDPIKMLMALEPGYYFGLPEANMGADRQLGFYAQNVRKAIGPEAAPDPVGNNPWGYFDRSVLAVVVDSTKIHESQIQELLARVTTLENA